ncbi:MAG: hypothetical protein QOG62_200 [Thermoleophilaceae bacterium]|nr:hypothetical protein [Thermoleophilaceae bacterium]
MTAVPNSSVPGPVVWAGGGELGIAWETGLAAGLLDEGVDLRRASLTVGTSAGSVVGAALMAGMDLRESADALAFPASDSALIPGGVDPAALRDAFAQLISNWMSGNMGGSTLAEVGAMALEASPIQENAFVDLIAARLTMGDEFPERLAVTTVDTADGEFVVYDSGSGAPLKRVIAASCSVPGLFPPVTVGDRRLMDGGARSVTNADVALRAEPAPALVVTLLPGIAPPGTLFDTWETALKNEVSQLEEASFPTHILRASPDDLNAIGPNPMDSSRNPQSAEAGRIRGRAEAALPAYDSWRI